MMKSCIIFTVFICHFALGNNKANLSPEKYKRVKRDAAGALHIVTNHADPIHADVKSEGEGSEKVVPPESIVYQAKSLRKSLPIHGVPPTAVDWVRSISRVVTLLVTFISASIEFFPAIQSFAMYIYNFVTNQ